jgi:hypothetical protein
MDIYIETNALIYTHINIHIYLYVYIRGYDLSNPEDIQAFIDDFRCQKAEILLKAVYKRLTGLDGPIQDQLMVYIYIYKYMDILFIHINYFICIHMYIQIHKL